MADINSPENYPTQYKEFLAALEKQVKENTYDFSSAANVVFKATNDELAMAPWMQQAADEGNAAAMYYIANQRRLRVAMSVPGAEMQKEIKEITALYKKGADQGFIPSTIHLAGFHVDGIGVAKDKAKAIKMLADASRTGSHHARLRWLQLTGRLASEKDFERKEVQFEVNRGNAEIIYEMARLTRDVTKARPHLIKAAEHGHGIAYAMLSQLLSKTHPDESFTFAIKGAQVFNSECMATVGYCMVDPGYQKLGKTKVTIPYDPSRGMYLIKVAAMLHSAYAHMLMGHIYYNGLFGVAKDMKRAFIHYELGTMHQDAQSQAVYAYMLLKGIGTKADPKEAMRHLAYLVRRGNLNASAILAYAHYKGLGVKKNAETAERLLNELAIVYPYAYAYLADMKAKEKDPKKVDQAVVDRYLRLASVSVSANTRQSQNSEDVKKSVQELFDKIQKEGDWVFNF